jgi:NDP-sugar pyrophosphorylase family protein
MWGSGSESAAAFAVEGVRITVIRGSPAAGTVGALAYARDALEEVVLLANGDSFFESNWLDLLTLPVAGNWLGRAALRPVTDGLRYRLVELGDARVSAVEPGGRVACAIASSGP